MKIGLDLSSLQGPHRMRGIGYTLINLVNHLADEHKQQYTFVFYLYKVSEIYPDPLHLLSLEGLNYELRYLEVKKRLKNRLPGKLGVITGLINQFYELRDLHLGDSRIKDLGDVDYFLQTDQSQCIPKSQRGTKLGLIIYDLIPYVLEWDYLWSYRVARTRGDSRKSALRKQVHRWLYAHKIKVNAIRAQQLFAISEQTKHDFVKFLGIRATKITVTPLGVSGNHTAKVLSPENIKRYTDTSWGYLPKAYSFDSNVPFLLYVGGADERRKLSDLVAAFNMLRAKDINIKLVLAGDCMQGPNNIATQLTRESLQRSSYLEDIIFVGFVDDASREWLYANCLCFIFPSRYEGFGLPVLEALAHGCPVISYENAATKEVALGVPLYVDAVLELSQAVAHLLTLTSSESDLLSKQGIHQSQKYRWQKTSQKILNAIESLD